MTPPTSTQAYPPIPGFGPYDLLSNITVETYDPKTKKYSVKPVPSDYRGSVINVILQKTNMGASTVTLQLMDPKRILLRKDLNSSSSSAAIKQGTNIVISGQRYTMVQFVKASDQLQLVFEANCVYRLRQQRGNIASVTGTNVVSFVASLVNALNHNVKPTDKNYVHFSSPPSYPAMWPYLSKNLLNKKIEQIPYGRGTTTDKNEDSWTAMSRIASTMGWRLWESDNTIYFGPDEWWSGEGAPGGQPPINRLKTPLVHKKQPAKANVPVLQEFTPNIQLIDFDWDVGKPFAQATVTCMLKNFNYTIGQIVRLNGMGPGDGYWMVSSMQREMFNVQASVGLQVAMPHALQVEPTSLPVQGFPLPPTGV